MAPSLVLASASRYRHALLERLRLPFLATAAALDEAPLQGETPREMVVRLARLKAQTVADAHPGAVVIGSDQVAVCGGRILGKPGSAAAAIEQLRAASGQPVEFLTAVCVLAPGAPPDEHVDLTTVRFRALTRSEIENYVELEQPFDCAGAFKSEKLGIALLESLDSKDPTALVGLPLAWLSGALRRAGLSAI